MLWIILVVIAIILLLILIGVLIFGKRKKEVSEIIGGDPNDPDSNDLFNKFFDFFSQKIKPVIIRNSGNQEIKVEKFDKDYPAKIKNIIATDRPSDITLCGIGMTSLKKIFKWNKHKIEQIPTLEEMLEIK